MKKVGFIGFFALVLFAFVAPVLSTEDITGVWNGSFEIGRHDGTMVLQLVQNGESIAGTIVDFSDNGDTTIPIKISPTVAGKIKNGKMTLYIGELVFVARFLERESSGEVLQGTLSGHMNKTGKARLVRKG